MSSGQSIYPVVSGSTICWTAFIAIQFFAFFFASQSPCLPRWAASSTTPSPPARTPSLLPSQSTQPSILSPTSSFPASPRSVSSAQSGERSLASRGMPAGQEPFSCTRGWLSPSICRLSSAPSHSPLLPLSSSPHPPIDPSPFYLRSQTVHCTAQNDFAIPNLTTAFPLSLAPSRHAAPLAEAPGTWWLFATENARRRCVAELHSF
jgi:hypothetical protein